MPNAGSANSQDFALACYNCVAAAAGSADLAVVMTDVPDPVPAGTTLTYVIAVSNNGPDAATAAKVQLDLPPELSFSTRLVGPSPSGLDWICASNATGVECALDGELPDNTLAPLLSIETTVALTAPAGSVEATAIVSSSTSDPDSGNNSATETTEITASDDSIFVHGFECASGLPGC